MRAAAVIALLALGACQTPCPGPAQSTSVATLHCEDGSDLRVTFSSANAVVEQEGYVTLNLPDRIAGSGYRYADSGAELSGRLGESLWTRPGAEETICRQTD